MKKPSNANNKAYQEALGKLPANLMNYSLPVQQALEKLGRKVSINKIYHVKKGTKIDWQILNAILIYAGIEPVAAVNPPTADDIANTLQLKCAS
jgi:hypothetical protein